MIRFHAAAFAAITAACLLSPVVAQDREPVAVHVAYADLNLTTKAGQAALKARIRGVSESACPEMAGTIEQKADSMRCRQEMQKDGALQIARLTTPADQQLALAERH